MVDKFGKTPISNQTCRQVITPFYSMQINFFF